MDWWGDATQVFNGPDTPRMSFGLHRVRQISYSAQTSFRLSPIRFFRVSLGNTYGASATVIKDLLTLLERQLNTLLVNKTVQFVNHLVASQRSMLGQYR